MTETHASADSRSRQACVHDRCTVGIGHSGPCTPIDPASKGQLDRGLGWIIMALVAAALLVGVGILGIGYLILPVLSRILRGGG